jgi:hypothetical protein
MVRTVTATAGGQTRFIVGTQGCGKRTQPEEQNQNDGEPTPHIVLMVQEKRG